MDKESFRIPQKAVIMDGDKYLIVKRAPDSISYPDHWDFPGGKIEHNEDPAKGLEREVLEETGLKVDVIKPLFTFHEFVHRPVFFVVYLCKKLSGQVKLSHEHTEYKWATKEEILKLDKIENFLRAFLENQ